jgi:chromate transport protein ChrA
MDIKVIIAIISVLMTLAGYFYYFRDIFAHKTKPHAYSWLVWSFLTAIAFAGQLHDHGGPGSYVTGVTAAVSIVIFAFAIKQGEKNITLSDKLTLAAAIAAVIPWLLTDDPVFSVILITIIDFLGLVPTIRKSYHKPYEETLITYAFSGLKFLLAIFALDHYTLTTWLYPASLVAANLLFVIMLMVRRAAVPPDQAQHRA